MKPKKSEKHFTATVYIISKEKPANILLLHHRKFDKWMPPGGHVEAHENPHETAIRETLEETGINIRPYLPKPKKLRPAIYLPSPRWIIEAEIPPHTDQPFHYHIDLGYAVTIPHQTGRHKKDEAHDIGWFSEKEIESLAMFDDVRQKFKELFKEHGQQR